ncbi:MAG: Ig-like domain-containing protein [Ruminococcus sp.]|nr:Ig-like domain-containing protein [Ruminococcus sp.]
MRKRIVLFMTCLVYLVVMICPLTSCNDDSGDTITKGDVIDQMMDAFGMYQYEQEEPYAEKVAKDNPHFNNVQAAFEWGVIDDKEIDLNEKATKGFLAEALVKCVGFKDTDDMSSDDIVQYAVDNEYVSFKYRGRTDSKRTVTPDEVAESISDSAEIWSNHKFEDKEEVKYGEGVVDLAKENVTAKDILVEEGNDNNMVLPVSMADKIKEGTAFVIPAEDGVTEARVVKADQVEVQGNRLMVKTSPADPDSVIGEMKASGNVQPDLTKSKVIDGAGNEISFDNNYQTSSINQSGDLPIYELGDSELKPSNLENTASVSGKLEFSMDGLKIKGKITSNSVEFSATGELPISKSSTNLFKSKSGNTKIKAKGETSISVSKSYEIKDIGFDYDYDFGWFFKLKSAYAKINYTTVDKSSVSYNAKGSLETQPKLKELDPESDLTKSLKSYAEGAKYDSSEKAAKTIKICSIPIVHGGVVSFNLDIKIKISFSGSVELVVTTENVKGIEYKSGKGVRYIKDQKQKAELSAKAKLEVTLYFGVSFRALGYNIVGFGVEGGIGFEGSATAHLIDGERHLLAETNFGNANVDVCDSYFSDLNGVSYTHKEYGTVSLKCETCFDFTTYWILKFGVDTDCLLKKFIKGSLEITIFDKSNKKIDEWSFHLEDGKKVSECTRKFKKDTNDSSDSSSDSSSNKSDSSSKVSNNTVDIDTYFVNLGIGETYKLSVEDIPEGYDSKDIVLTSADNKIAKVSSDGTITGVSGGQTSIIVQTKDKKYSVECAVYVAEAAKVSQKVTQA